MKTEFETEMGDGDLRAGYNMEVKIIGAAPRDNPYVAICATGNNGSPRITGWIPDKDLERFAVNILKALKSKKLKP